MGISLMSSALQFICYMACVEHIMIGLLKAPPSA